MGKKGVTPPPEEPKKEEAPPVKKDEQPPGEPMHGEFLFKDGSSYQGEYLKNGSDALLHGRGLLTFGPESFEGFFDRGAYKVGRFKGCDGAIYTGSFLNNAFHGAGEYTWPDGRVYQGTWKDGHMHGKCQLVNFALGDRTFTGFALRGLFDSTPAAQAEARRDFLAEYGAECLASATTALREVARFSGPEGLPRQYLAAHGPSGPTNPGDVQPEAISEHALVAAAVQGPFPEASAVQAAAIQAFVAGLGEGLESPHVSADIYEEPGRPIQQHFPTQRLRLPQLQHVGQAVQFSLAAPDNVQVGAITALVLVNVSKEYDFAKANWKLVHIETAQSPT